MVAPLKNVFPAFRSGLLLVLLLVPAPWVFADSHTPTDYPALGEPEFPGLCPYRGHIGKYPCLKVSAQVHELYSCKGKNLYYSKVDGEKGCYSCPEGYSRFSPTRKMDHDKACTRRQPGKNDYASATKVGVLVSTCASGQFKHDGRCKSCPNRTRRKHFLGLDSGNCEVEKAYHCNTGLVLHKSEPENEFDQARNWLGLSYKKKYCGIPFSLKQYGEDILTSEANRAAIDALYQLGRTLTRDDRTTQETMDRFKQAVEDNRLREAYDILQSFEEFGILKEALADAQNSALAVGNAALNFTVTSGWVVADLSAGIGYNFEWGAAIDFAERKVKRYRAHGLSKGVSLGADSSLSLGIWKGAFNTGYSQGYVGAATVGLVGVGLGVWSDYYTPNRSNGSNQPQFLGLSGTFGAGQGGSLEIGEYNEIYTKVYEEVSMLEGR